MAAIPLSSVIGGPISGLILDRCDGFMGLKGWQWLFIIEGVPSVLVGLWALRYLTDKPNDAAWLEPEERSAVQARLDQERKHREAIRRYSVREALSNRRVLTLSIIYFGLVSGNYGLSFWLPQIMKSAVAEMGLDKMAGVPINALTGYLVAIPYAFGVVAMIWWTRHSDRTKERVWHVAAPAIVGGASLIAAAYLSSPALAGLALILCTMATYSALPTFWTLPTAFLTGSAAAGGIALINSIGNLRGIRRPLRRRLDQGGDRRRHAGARGALSLLPVGRRGHPVAWARHQNGGWSKRHSCRIRRGTPISNESQLPSDWRTSDILSLS